MDIIFEIDKVCVSMRYAIFVALGTVKGVSVSVTGVYKLSVFSERRVQARDTRLKCKLEEEVNFNLRVKEEC